MKFFTAWKIQLVATHKKLARHSLQSILHGYFIFRRTQYDSYGFVIPFGILFILEIIEIEIHLPNVFITDFTAFQINEYKTFKNSMIKHQIDLEMSSSQC